MRKILIIFVLLAVVSSCKKDLTSLNVNPKAASSVPSYTLFSNAQLNLANVLATPNVNINIWRMIAQHWTETTYPDESNYDLGTRNIPQNWFHALYRDVLKNFDEAKKLIPTDVIEPVAQKNQLAIVEIMQVFTYHYLVSTFGNIPYTDALNIDNTQPKYDDAATIYGALMTRLNTAIADLNTSGESFGSSDLLYGGDVAKWKKFANSFKMKMGIIMADYDAAGSKAAVEAAAAGAFTSNADNAAFQFLTAPPNTNPVWVNLVQSGRKDFVAANTLVDAMKALSDPRVPLYFTTDNTGIGYTGGIYGANNNYATFSKPEDAILEPDFPTWLMDYAEVEFILAEAVERGYAVGGTAASHYNAAVTASIEFWGGSALDATTYLALPAINYATAAGTYKQKIGTQKWIALYERGHDAWTEWRRLDYPALVAPPAAVTTIPIRYTYPVSEQNLNKTNYDVASAAIGGDQVATKLWFDKF
ncbi:MAG TPA: SusD/RagB family nutrient-binding outer membrane lipoprotein [Chitinophagaceae bacterium]|nr:SusD/RagB family nutrient-binding outer membrane lipoprotein [Chitinophagaceae bacterium]